MSELNREQIIKALGCCVKVGGYRDAQYCNDCPLHEERCALLLPQNALSLIKELTEENERLKGRNEHLAECLDIEDKYKDRLRGILLQFTDIVHKWGNKNGYDTSEISLVPVIYEANTIKSQIVVDTVRKYREGLYRELASLGAKDKFNKEFFLTKADQIAKEMLEDNNND